MMGLVGVRAFMKLNVLSDIKGSCSPYVMTDKNHRSFSRHSYHSSYCKIVFKGGCRLSVDNVKCSRFIFLQLNFDR